MSCLVPQKLGRSFLWLALSVPALFPIGALAAEPPSGLSETVGQTPIELATVDEQSLDADRAGLRASLAALDRRLIPGSANSTAWKKHLDWETLTAFANDKGAPKLPALQESLDRLTSGEPGLELEEFQQVSRDARRLFDHLLLATVPEPNKFATAQVEELSKQLEADAEMRDPRASFAVEQRLDFFQGVAGGEAIAKTIATRFGRSNLFVSASETLLNRMAQRPVNEQRPVDDVILGTRLRGTGTTNGWVRVDVVPSQGSARLLMSMSGNVSATTMGTNGPACISTASETGFNGNKLVQLTRESFATSPSSFNAQTSTQTRGVSKRGGGFGERIVVAVARRRIAEQKACAEQIAAGKAEQRLRDSFNQGVREQLSIARRNFEQEFLAPLERRHAPPKWMLFSTTDDSLEIEMLQAGRGQLGADGSPPAEPGRDLAVRLHQSGANNLAAAVLSGAKLSRQSADQPARLNVPVPAWAKRLSQQSNRRESPADEAGFKPWELTFRRNRPVSFRFDEGQVEVLVHAARVEAGEDDFQNWDIIVRFEPVMKEGQLVLKRIGEIDALPTDFDPQSGGRLNSRQVGFRNNLKAQLNKPGSQGEGLPEEVPLRPIELRDSRGTLVAKQMAASMSWLTVGWDAE